MELKFFKYQGTGNDFVMVDNRDDDWEKKLQSSQVAFLCDRHFGIGADGLILLSESKDHDFRMIYYNSDGQESTMCGNGGRCLAAFAQFLGVAQGHMTFDATDGLHHAWVEEDWVRLQMVAVKGYEKMDGEKSWLDTGSPHLILKREEVDQLDVKAEGSRWRYDKQFEAIGGTNVNFVKERGENRLWVRTYERGVENETFSCGTGVTAAAYAHLRENGKEGKVEIKTLGGELEVEILNLGSKEEEVFLSGPARQVFAGKIALGHS